MKIYINKNKKRPSSKSNIPEIKKMGMFISDQLKNIKIRGGWMKDDLIYNKWELFVEDYQKYFN